MRSASFVRFLLPAFCAGMVAVSCGGDTPESPTCDGDCQTPPAAVCEGDRAISFSLFGECSNGQCVYPPVVDDCGADGGTCQAGACVAPPDPCDGVVCNEPPATNCDGDTLNQYAADSGECVDGGCTYEVQQTDCAARRQVCQDGACVTPVNLCAGILCEEPPADGCDGESAVTYVDEGECNPEDGECVYAEVTRRDCAAEGLFCNNARCQAENPCAGITCSTPPENFCNENDNAVVYVARGTCSGGECSYLESVRDCDNATEVCEDGACRDRLPCDDVVCDRPPAATCRGTLRNFYEPLGTCTDGLCTYVLRSQECSATDQICQGGACIDPDACFGVVCNSIPATECRGNTVVSYRAGSCQLPGGACSYPEVTLDCAATGRTCVDGACEITDPCAGVTCLTPPTAECLDGVAVEYLAPGECNPETGLCEYDPSVDDCGAVSGFVCEAGVCEFVDLCAEVVCEIPDFFCDGDVAVSYTDGGVCFDGACDLTASEVREDCTETESTCFEGECRGAGFFTEADSAYISEIYFGSGRVDGSDVWIELRNTTPAVVEVGGITLASQDDTDSREWTIPTGTTIPPFGYLLMAPESSTFDLVDVRFPDNAVVFSVAGGQMLLQRAEGDGNPVTYTPAVVANSGRSWQVDPGVPYSSQTESAWCQGEILAESGLFASPRLSNHACESRFADSPLVVTEIMTDGLPLGFADEEWFEVYNAGSDLLNLEGLVVSNGADFRMVTQEIGVAPGEYFVVAETSANLFGVNAFIFPELDLDGAGGAVTLGVGPWSAGTLTYTGGFGQATGVSGQLGGNPATSDSTSPANWCASTASYGSLVSQVGTPGRANNSCP